MKLSPAGRDAINAREGERLVVYRDDAGNPTVCNGHLVTGADHLQVGGRVSPAQCAVFAARDLGAAEDAVNRLVTVPLNQNQFDALVSLVFNIGSSAFAGSTLRKLLNADDYTGAQAQFAAWHYSGGKPDGGLLNRRMQEAVQFGTPVVQPAAIAAAPVTAGDIPQTLAPVAPVASYARTDPPPTKVTQTRTGRALVGSAATGIAAGVAAVKPALDAINTFKAATDGLPVWLLAIAAPLAAASCAFALYGIWHKQRSLQGAAP